MNRSILTLSALVVVAALATVGFVSLFDASWRNAKLADRVTDLEDQYDELQSNYYNLLSNFSSLKWNYTNLLMQDPQMIPNPASSASDNVTLEARLEALQALYTSLKAEYDQYVADYQRLRSMTDQRLLRGSACGIITPDDPEVTAITRSVTGSDGNSTEEINWGDIKAIYDWVNVNIQYREDGLYPILPDNPSVVMTKGLEHTDQMAQFPNETLSLRMGDCEDIAALLSSMLRCYFNKHFTVECVWITSETSGHVAVVIPFSEDKIVILDPVRDYYSRDTLGDMALNTISTEIYNWMNIWRPSMGNDLHVYRVFSDYMDTYFDSTEQYINWMYSR